MTDFAPMLKDLTAGFSTLQTRNQLGKLTAIEGSCLRAAMAGVGRGDICHVERPTAAPLKAEVIAVSGATVLLSPFGCTDGLSHGAIVRPAADALSMMAGSGMLGRVVDAFGIPLDALGQISGDLQPTPIRADAPPPMERPMIDTPLVTGLRAIDGPLAMGQGQRVGIFGPPGVGKSRLIAAIASQTDADAIVIGLVGERGREVREFIERDLPQEARSRVVVVAATSDRPAVERALCAHSATAVAEALCKTGASVLLLIDSLTRTARALREIGLAAGETPTRRGYPASVYPALPAIIERAGRTADGSITALYTVLLEGDGEGDPIAEEVRSLTDGHIMLSRKLAESGHYPAIDVVESLSRCMPAVANDQHIDSARTLRSLLAKHREIELLLQVGEYSEGGDTLADQAVRAKPGIDTFLQQAADEQSEHGTTLARMREVTG